TLLPPKALALGHREAPHALLCQRFPHLFELERFDDGGDLFHGEGLRVNWALCPRERLHSALDDIALPHHAPMSVSLRGGHVENLHHGWFAVVDAAGTLLARSGEVDRPVFTRSALKPLQAMPLIARAAERWQLDDADVALLCASHNG